ncbi:methyltransferase (TIGR00027 family) [Actinoplanes tereljensis]|uniref:S-adenosyl-L-methionine-dependent methyltransferase n=1 Tax=Paractinoplanes tereljensis TaxID=571912 RepID=A0A919TX10_9ACTN|nr:SAM-dependent methyltransferase [Actinoplanes tereljensis]GIF25746.1 S-adenosyl-L-methionine-dependent methyltransferase [Actinoplanes tereljensis]
MDAQLDPLARTALWTASLRAREHARPDHLFTDPLAEYLAGDEGPQIMRSFEATVQGGVEDPALAVRTRFFDDAMQDIATRYGTRQVVLVAAGMDSRAYRLNWQPDTRLYELDRPELLDLKAQQLRAASASPTCTRITVSVDLTAQWSAPLRNAGFRPQSPTLWLVEGLLYFLDGPQLNALMQDISDLSAPGSWILADFVTASSLTSPTMRPWLDRMAASGHAWHSGSDDPEALFGGYGWRVACTDYGSSRADFGRWAMSAVAPGVPGTRGRYIVMGDRIP